MTLEKNGNMMIDNRIEEKKLTPKSIFQFRDPNETQNFRMCVCVCESRAYWPSESRNWNTKFAEIPRAHNCAHQRLWWVDVVIVGLKLAKLKLRNEEKHRETRIRKFVKQTPTEGIINFVRKLKQ